LVWLLVKWFQCHWM